MIVVFPDHTHFFLLITSALSTESFMRCPKFIFILPSFIFVKKVGFYPQILNNNLKTTDYASLFDGLCEFPIWITTINLKIRKC